MNTNKRNAIIKEIKQILKDNDIQFEISLSSNQCYSYPSQRFIFLGFNSREFKSRDHMLTALFHEIAHIQNYLTNKYFTYHNEQQHNKKSVAYAIRFGLRAEQHTDKIGEKLMALYDPKATFHPTYTKPHMKTRYKTEFLTTLVNSLKND
jgi:hypothetical protein